MLSVLLMVIVSANDESSHILKVLYIETASKSANAPLERSITNTTIAMLVLSI